MLDARIEENSERGRQLFVLLPEDELDRYLRQQPQTNGRITLVPSRGAAKAESLRDELGRRVPEQGEQPVEPQSIPALEKAAAAKLVSIYPATRERDIPAMGEVDHDYQRQQFLRPTPSAVRTGFHQRPGRLHPDFLVENR